MKTPPLLLSAALLFWGWQTHLLPLAVFFSIAMESRCILKTRWQLSRPEWSHLTDICTLILLCILTTGFFRDKTRIMYDIGKLLPGIFYPLFIAQLYSVNGTVDLAALSLIARRQKKKTQPVPPLDISYPYLLICLIAAGFGNRTDGSYFSGICLLGAWGAYGIRSKQTPVYRWVLMMILAAGLGYSGHTGLYRLQEILTDFSSRFFDPSNNPLKSSTSLGDIGTLKLSDAILFRATPSEPPNQPILLREASYNAYQSPNWHAINAILRARPPAHNRPIHLCKTPAAGRTQTLHIQSRIRKGKDTLKLPGDTVRIDGLPEAIIQTNHLGAIVISNVEKGVLDYRVSFAAGSSADSAPNALDLDVPKSERPAIARIIAELGLENLPPTEIIQKLEHTFDTEYSYTLRHKGKGAQRTPLANFLLDRKAGHCEFFATATVLILRACNLPARYTTGYVAAEYSALEKQFIIRKRHAHAWTRVYVDGHWQDLDTTSPNWLALEAENSSPFRFLTDFGSFIAFKLSLFRWSEKDYMGHLAIGLLLLLILMISNRLRKQKQTGKKTKSSRNKIRIPKQTAANNEFYRLEKLLTKKGYPRNPGETLLDWTDRMQKANASLLNYDTLRSLIGHHYRRRFAKDPAADSSPLKSALNQLVDSLRH